MRWDGGKPAERGKIGCTNASIYYVWLLSKFSFDPKKLKLFKWILTGSLSARLFCSFLLLKGDRLVGNEAIEKEKKPVSTVQNKNINVFKEFYSSVKTLK